MVARKSNAFAALTLAALFIFTALPRAAAAYTLIPTDLPAPSAIASPAPAECGTVRVLLTHIGSELTETDILLDGSYSINGDAGFRFERGSKLHIFLSDGKPVLRYEGLTLHMDSGFTLTRHRTDGTNGLRIGAADGLYEGDLRVTALDGALRMVLSIYIEDYVKGVVPYEMNDAFPPEALMAQAVAARTYALKRRNAARDYDVYDSTRDQVFRGRNHSYANAENAVNATRGLVGVYEGKLAECFYSASNGGQTELYANAFDAEDNYGYLDMRKDPYDFANPDSRVKMAEIPKQPGAVPLRPELEALLKAALSEQLSSMGYDDSPENIEIIDITEVAPHTPKYDLPSRVFTKLRFVVKVMARHINVLPSAAPEASAPTEAAAPSAPPAENSIALSDMQPINAPLTVDIDIFNEAEAALGLSINRRDNELITVRETAASFIVEARRFGHGLGMSQRGAEYMAGHYNWTHQQILSFYYPGMEFVTRNYAPEILPAIQSELISSPRPTAAPTPRPTYIPIGELSANSFYVEVALANADSTLNLRAEPSTSSGVICTLMDGQPLSVLDELGNGWIKVSVGPYQGYVAAQYLKII